MVTAQQLKDYLRLPPDNEEQLDLYLQAAIAKADAAGIPQYTNNSHYDLFLLALAAMYYDNRGMGKADELIDGIVNSFVLELRYAEDNDGKES